MVDTQKFLNRGKSKGVRLSYVSLFSGAGVGCYGFHQAGFNCVASNELIAKRLNIQRINNICKYPSGYVLGDLTLKETKDAINNEILKWKSEEKIDGIDLVVATPPCQGMSVANHKKGNENTRNSLIIESIKCILDITPKLFLFENVTAFLNTSCTDIDGHDKRVREAIEQNLGGKYNILFEVINFKDYGGASSRTRTLVIGVRKDLQDTTPYDLFPDKARERTLAKVIGDLKPLTTMGEIDRDDFYHGFRRYAQYMFPWIEELHEGQSAFDNSDPQRKPHRLVNGEIVINQNKNGDKYRRCCWNKVGPCIHTRNDILASQSTIHPRDNRVFSIRELMRLMTIPDEFRWFEKDLNDLNQLSIEQKAKLLRHEELNIRQCIGEAAPTAIFRQIANKAKVVLNNDFLTETQLRKIISENQLDTTEKITAYVDLNGNVKYTDTLKILELANAQRQKHAAFYTRQDICFSLIKELPQFKGSNLIRIIEPSVGIGNFIPLLFRKYEDVPKVQLDLVDIDSNSLQILKVLLNRLGSPPNFSINYFHDDFLTMRFHDRYDAVIGNPPFGKLKLENNENGKYKSSAINKDTENMFVYFLEKSVTLADTVALISPKSILGAPEFNTTRRIMSKYYFQTIEDYGEQAFKGVRIETLGLVINTRKKSSDHLIKIESKITNNIRYLRQPYVMSDEYPTWLIYRNQYFDDVARQMKLGIFTVFRDRQITKKITRRDGSFRVLKSRNIGNNQIVDVKDYDSYVDSLDGLAVGKYLNQPNLVLVPNLTYHPRAASLPANTVTDGSVAILVPKNGMRLSANDLVFYATEQFRKFYGIARNHGTRSLNVDSNSVYYYGKPLDGSMQEEWTL